MRLHLLPASLGLIWLSTALAAPPAAVDTSVAAQVLRGRAAKDSLLRQAPDSPLPAAARSGFRGLEYYPVDRKLRMVGDLSRYGRSSVLQVPATDGTTIAMARFGRLRGLLRGTPVELEVYRGLEDGALVVFFADRTNGRGSYAGGRYAPVTPLADGRYLLDFNLAYNPYCAYNPDYVCPLPPPQNHLAVPVEAGEKAPPAALAH
jgi:uncharacterized protein (DUF1684 family)